MTILRFIFIIIKRILGIPFFIIEWILAVFYALSPVVRFITIIAALLGAKHCIQAIMDGYYRRIEELFIYIFGIFLWQPFFYLLWDFCDSMSLLLLYDVPLFQKSLKRQLNDYYKLPQPKKKFGLFDA